MSTTSTTQTLKNITPKQISDKGVQALSNRPNSFEQYGMGGLSPAQLKLWFDKLATFLADKINEIHNTISSTEAAKYIRLFLDDYGVENLHDLVESFKDGTFSSEILQIYPSANSFQKTVSLEKCIHDIAQTISAYSEEFDKIWDSLAFLEEVRNRLYVLQEAPPIEALSTAMVLTPPPIEQLASMH